MNSQLLPHVLLPEPELSFHPDRALDNDIHPLRGLLKYGPYSKSFVPDPIRVATISSPGDEQRLYAFMRELPQSARANERTDYLPDWPGFSRVFGVHMRGAGSGCHILLDEGLDAEITSAPLPHVVLADAMSRAIQRLDLRRVDFDVLFIYLPQRWASCFYGPEGDDFDLHDHLKAIAASRALPVQIVREDKALAYKDRAAVMWRIGLALYAKAGGVPWKLAHHDSDIAYIGISYALKESATSQDRFVTCCSQVFDSDGAGLEFIAYDAKDVQVQRDNPYLSRTEMFRVMTRALELYRRRHAGRSPRRVMVHKTTEFKKDEIDGCMEAFHLCESVDLIQIVEDVSWRGARIDGGQGTKGQAAMFPVQRGSLFAIGPREALLWTHGSVPGIGKRPDYFQGSKGTPKPLKLIRHAGHGTWDDTARAVLALTKMDWNNDALYDYLPVTLGYSKTLARVVKRMGVLGSAPYAFRFFM